MNDKISVTKQQRELYIRSNIDSTNSWLKCLLEDSIYGKRGKSELKNLDDFQVNFMKNTFMDYMDDVVSPQWYSTTPDIDSNIKDCELCGNNQCKEKFIIKNRINGKTMSVGSSCINHFNGINIDSIKRHRKSAKQLERQTEFTYEVGNVEERLSNWQKEYDDLPYEISQDLDSTLKDTLKEAKLIYQNFVDNELSSGGKDRFKELIEVRDAAIIKAKELCEENRSKEFPCTKAVGTWLTVRKLDKSLEVIRKNNGIINQNKIKAIHENCFVKSLRDEFNKKLELSDFNIAKDITNGDYQNVHFSNDRLDLGCLRVTNVKLMRNFGDRLYVGDSSINNNEFVEIVEVDFSKHTYDLYNQLNIGLSRTKYKVDEVEESNLFHRYYVIDKVKKAYAHSFLLEKFINDNLDVILYRKNNIELLNKLNRIGASNWKPIDEATDVAQLVRNRAY